MHFECSAIIKIYILALLVIIVMEIKVDGIKKIYVPQCVFCRVLLPAESYYHCCINPDNVIQDWNMKRQFPCLYAYVLYLNKQLISGAEIYLMVNGFPKKLRIPFEDVLDPEKYIVPLPSMYLFDTPVGWVPKTTAD